jgi:electron transport complex protein RnfD
MDKKLIVSSTPHIRSKETVSSVMRDVIIALLPAAIMGIIFFGINAALLIIVSIVSAVVFEALFQKIAKKPVTVTDCSAVITGLLLAMNLPSTAPLWIPVVGAFVAIVLAKQVFGGLGQNFINPALAGRAFLVASYPTYMTGSAFVPTRFAQNIDAATYATPLANIKSASEMVNGAYSISTNDFLNAFIGNIGGCIGETCALALILGGIYLIIRKVISWRIPVTYILTVLVLSYIFYGFGLRRGDAILPIYELFTGGLMLGAFFMATDYASSPITPLGQIIMGIGCGILTVLIRVFGGYPEGVSYSILLMNLCVPLIERFTKPKKFGKVAKQ